MIDEIVGSIIVLCMFALLLGFYFLPTIVGYYMEKLPKRMGLILVINLFLGWTVVGWLIAWFLVITGRFREPRHEMD